MGWWFWEKVEPFRTHSPEGGELGCWRRPGTVAWHAPASRRHMEGAECMLQAEEAPGELRGMDVPALKQG